MVTVAGQGATSIPRVTPGLEGHRPPWGRLGQSPPPWLAAPGHGGLGPLCPPASILLSSYLRSLRASGVRRSSVQAFVHSNTFVYIFILYLFTYLRGREKGRAPVCWVTPQMPAMAWAGADARTGHSVLLSHVGGGSPAPRAIAAASESTLAGSWSQKTARHPASIFFFFF